MRTTPIDSVRCRFFHPVEEALRDLSSTRSCPKFSDEEFIASGIGRVVADVRSGRDWVQQLRMWMDSRLTVANFFNSLGSQRRLSLVADVARHVRLQIDRHLPLALDPLAQHSELNGYAVYGSDGHYEALSAHAPKGEEASKAVGAFYSISLRSHSFSLLDIARPVRKYEHDIVALKRIGSTALRMSEATGTKVIHVYDPAVIDYAQWMRWKAKGVYIISREKENSAVDTLGNIPWDHEDPRNIGVLTNTFVGTFSGVLLRRITYRDPATGKTFAYLTTDMNLPPGLVAFLYKLRWDIEKVFDEKKNKLQEKRAWACSDVSRSLQAQFVCLAHNLMLLLERCLESENGITDIKVQDKRSRRTEESEAKMSERGEIPNPLVQQCTRMTQRSLQFIRWLRRCLLAPTSYVAEIDLLRPFMEAYIT